MQTHCKEQYGLLGQVSVTKTGFENKFTKTTLSLDKLPEKPITHSWYTKAYA